MRKLILIFVVLTVASALAERQPYERYQSIVDRQMFGPLPADFDPTKMPSEVSKTKKKGEQELTAEQEQVKKAIQFSVLNVSSSGEIYVGFTDSADPKTPRHYYLKVGETMGGWTVMEADKDAATMTIEKDGIEVSLKLGGDSSSNAGSVSRVGNSGSGASTSPRAGSSIFGGALSIRKRHLLERQKQEEDAAKRVEAEKERAAREEEEKKVREAEREEQRTQLLQIQEELRKAREARENAKKEQENASDGENSGSEPEN